MAKISFEDFKKSKVIVNEDGDIEISKKEIKNKKKNKFKRNRKWQQKQK